MPLQWKRAHGHNTSIWDFLLWTKRRKISTLRYFPIISSTTQNLKAVRILLMSTTNYLLCYKRIVVFFFYYTSDSVCTNMLSNEDMGFR